VTRLLVICRSHPLVAPVIAELESLRHEVEFSSGDLSPLPPLSTFDLVLLRMVPGRAGDLRLLLQLALLEPRELVLVSADAERATYLRDLTAAQLLTPVDSAPANAVPDRVDRHLDDHPSPRLAAVAIEEQLADVSARYRLTRRERDVLELLVRGRSNAQIATALTVALRTVEFHVSHVLGKLGVQSRSEVILRVLGHGQDRSPTSGEPRTGDRPPEPDDPGGSSGPRPRILRESTVAAYGFHGCAEDSLAGILPAEARARRASESDGWGMARCERQRSRGSSESG